MAEADIQFHQGSLDTMRGLRPEQFPQTRATIRRCVAELLHACGVLLFTPTFYFLTLIFTGTFAALFTLIYFAFASFAMFHVGFIAVTLIALLAAHFNREFEASMIIAIWRTQAAFHPSSIDAKHPVRFSPPSRSDQDLRNYQLQSGCHLYGSRVLIHVAPLDRSFYYLAFPYSRPETHRTPVSRHFLSL